MTKKTSTKSSKTSNSRRQFVKRAAYVAPAVLSLQASSSYAREGSQKVPPTSTPTPRSP